MLSSPFTRGAEAKLDYRAAAPARGPMNAPLLGIIGGMGPAATADFYRRIIDETPAQRDQDHVPVVIWADPRTPDRSASLEGHGEDPTPWLLHAAQNLVELGATVIAMPCNTAHAFLTEVRAHIPIPIIDMIDKTTDAASEASNIGDLVGVLATSGTLKAELYHESLTRRGLHAIVPRADEQRESVATAIRAIKAGRATRSTIDDLESAAQSLVARGATSLIMGCSEIPLCLTQDRVSVPLVDSAHCLATAAVRHMLGDSRR